jgi:hypothetical protein
MFGSAGVKPCFKGIWASSVMAMVVVNFAVLVETREWIVGEGNFKRVLKGSYTHKMEKIIRT